MAKVSVYLNFKDQCEAAFEFYKQVFNTDYDDDGISRMGDMPDSEGFTVPEAEEDLVLHVSMTIFDDYRLMGSDVPKSMGSVRKGNNVSITLSPDSLEETKRLFSELSEDGEVYMPFEKAFWGAYFGSCIDKFGVSWQFDYADEE